MNDQSQWTFLVGVSTKFLSPYRSLLCLCVTMYVFQYKLCIDRTNTIVKYLTAKCGIFNGSLFSLTFDYNSSGYSDC